MKLPENICRYRTKKGLSQEQLAEAMQVSRQSVSKWETGASVPELDKLLRLSELFGITLDALVGNQEPAPAAPEDQAPAQAAVPETAVQQAPAALPLQKLLGLVLLGLGLLAALMGLLSQGRSRELVILAGVCTALCGGFCLGSRYPQLYCGWSLWAGWAGWVFLLTRRWEDEGFLIGLTLVLVGCLLIWTVWAHRSGRTRIPPWLGLVGSLVLLMLGLLLVINITPPGAGYEVRPEQITGG